MSEQTTPDKTEALPEVAEAPQLQASVGDILAAARDAAGMSVDEVAAKLRLSVRQIRALEEGDAATLPDPTFVRGFIRNYAKLLGLEAEPLIIAYAAKTPSVAEQSISLHSENIRIAGFDRKNWLPYLLAVLVLLVSLAAWLMLTEPHVPSATVVTQPPVQADAEAPEVAPATEVQALPEVSAQPESPVAEVQANESSAVVQPAVEAATAVTPLPAPAVPAATAPIAGSAKLEMTYSEEVWLSVLDRDGKEIFNKTKPANSQDMVEGLPPLHLVIGNAAGVRLTYKGKPVDLAPHTKANVARLTLE